MLNEKDTTMNTQTKKSIQEWFNNSGMEQMIVDVVINGEATEESFSSLNEILAYQTPEMVMYFPI